MAWRALAGGSLGGGNNDHALSIRHKEPVPAVEQRLQSRYCLRRFTPANGQSHYKEPYYLEHELIISQSTLRAPLSGGWSSWRGRDAPNDNDFMSKGIWFLLVVICILFVSLKVHGEVVGWDLVPAWSPRRPWLPRDQPFSSLKN